jgi:hypothetical protein
MALFDVVPSEMSLNCLTWAMDRPCLHLGKCDRADLRLEVTGTNDHDVLFVRHQARDGSCTCYKNTV